jgi:nitronate monooxygenase
MPAEKIREEIRKIRTLTEKPFSVNLFIPEEPQEDPVKINEITQAMQPYRKALGLAAKPNVTQYAQSFAEQITAVLEEKVPVFSFTFGTLAEEWVEQLKAANILIMGTATTVKEAVALENNGIDVIVTQGSEAGGHRGSFLAKAEDSLVGTMALVPQVVDHVNIPVVAAGGIMDGRGVVAALALGASAAQLGTAFLTTHESGANPVHIEAILQHDEDETQLTNMFSGKLARGIKNKFMIEMQPHVGAVPDYPIQNTLTRDLRQAAAQQKNSDFMSLWAGQGIRLSHQVSAQDLMEQLISQVELTLARLP